MENLGFLNKISPRKKWSHEALDFTPWLAENIQCLNEALGLELEVVNMEVAVGPYSADILAKDTGTDRYVIIENQLKKTNHDHLGKAITYASVLDASTIIWIATNFTEEHQRALDWLNDHSDEAIMFYGVQIELWQIDNSKPALRFNVVSKPSLAVRKIAKNQELSESKLLQLKFWEEFRDKLDKTKNIPFLRPIAPQGWYDVTLGKPGIHICCRCNVNTNTISVCVYIRKKIVDTMLPFLENRKSEIELAIGEALQWDAKPNSQDKTIVLYHQTDFFDPVKRESSLNWLVEQTIKFREVFSSIIKEAPK